MSLQRRSGFASSAAPAASSLSKSGQGKLFRLWGSTELRADKEVWMHVHDVEHVDHESDYRLVAAFARCDMACVAAVVPQFLSSGAAGVELLVDRDRSPCALQTGQQHARR